MSVSVGGVSYRLSKFTLPLYQQFLAWAKSQLPDPFDNIAEKIKGLPDNLAKYLIDKAEDRASKRGTLSDPDTQALAESPEGLRKILSLLFAKFQPSLTEAEVVEIIERGIAEHGETFLADCFPAKPRDAVS